MLTLYRRHSKKHCKFTKRSETKCSCPVWVDGTLPSHEDRILRSLDTTDWRAATARVREWEIAGKIVVQQTRTTVTAAIADFLADLAHRGLAPGTIRKFTSDSNPLADFARARKIEYVDDFTLPHLRAFRHAWIDKPLSASRKLTRLRAFFKFCIDSGWMTVNPARGIKSPKWQHRQTMPFSSGEVNRILDATKNAKTRALILLLRFTGLRIGDAVCLEKTQVAGDRLMIRTRKSGAVVHIPLPPNVIAALQYFTHKSDRYFFWSGESAPSTVTGVARKILAEVFSDAGISEGHAHRFRDTFAVSLLNEGTPIDVVATLLGHSDSRVTEKFYSPWIKDRQDQADIFVQRTWETAAEKTRVAS